MTDHISHLRSSRVIAIVGCSGRTSRTSHTIARYLLSNGFEIVPVNPNYDKILGLDCYPSIADIPDGVRVDIVNIFRNPRHTAGIVREVIEFRDARGYTPLIWTQLGVSSLEAAEIAAAENIPYVANRCIMVEHRLNVGKLTG